MSHRGAPYHRWHQTLKNRLLLENYYLPGDLEARVGAFVEHYNQARYHESLGNLTPADAYLSRGQTVLLERERIKRRRLRFASCSTARRPRSIKIQMDQASVHGCSHRSQIL